MRPNVSTLTLIAGVAALLFSADTNAQHHDHGEVNFPISCSAASASHFEHGLGMLHHMMYEQAEDHFQKAAEADPSCAMAHWGIAMTQLRPLWAPPTSSEFAHGRSAVREARARTAETPREAMHIDAIAAYFEGNDLTHRERLARWKSASESLYEAHPDDVDAGAFYALSLIANAPPDDQTYRYQRKAGELLEGLHDHAPQHPGLFHYIIHAYDNPVLAHHAVDIAHAYDKIAPDVPHALHMPSHIFVRLGHWPDVVSWNERSAEAALRQPVGDKTSMHHAHALDYKMYAYLQLGEDEKAREVLEAIRSIDNYQVAVGTTYGVPAAMARFPLERRAWAEAAELDVRSYDGIPWDSYPEFEAIGVFASGMGSARSGDLDGAREALDRLNALYQQTEAAGNDYWLVHVDIYRKAVDAWIAHATGDEDKGLSLMKAAADLEDSIEKHPVSPGAILPARELYGDMLVETHRYDEAIEAYQAALAISPQRFNSLAGSALAAERANRMDDARRFYRQLTEVVGDRPVYRDALSRAQTVLDGP